MAALMRCNQPHFRGNDFVPIGTVLPAGHPKIIPQFFEPLDVDDPPVDDPPAEEPRVRRGRPPLPRDADGNIIRED